MKGFQTALNPDDLEENLSNSGAFRNAVCQRRFCIAWTFRLCGSSAS